MTSNRSKSAGCWRAADSKDWRAPVPPFLSAPAVRSGSSISPLSEPPVPGQVIRFPSVKVPETSVLWDQVTEQTLGRPWAHPALVIRVEGGLITCLQMTSKDVIKCSKNAAWADRYWPVSHDGKADHHPDPSEGRKVWLLQGCQMAKPTHVNLERPVKCEWHHFSNFNAGTAKGPRLEEESLQRLLQSQPYTYRPDPIPASSIPVIILKRSDASIDRSSSPSSSSLDPKAIPFIPIIIRKPSDASIDRPSSPSPPTVFSPTPSPTSSPATSPATSRSSSPLDSKTIPSPSVEKYVPPWKRQATATGLSAPKPH